MQYARSCPFLQESDTLSLSPVIEIHKRALYDTTLMIEHRIDKRALPFLQLLYKGTSLQEILQSMNQLQINDSEVYELLGFLNIIGALQRRRRNCRVSIQATLHQLKLTRLGIRHPALTHRSPSNHRTLLTAIVFTTLPLTAASTALSILFMASGLFAPTAIVFVCTVCLVVFITSIYIHELAHLFVIHKIPVKSNLMRQGMRLGIIHPILPRSGEVLSAFLGPLTGLVFCALCGCLAFFEGWPVIAGICALESIIHMAALLPWYGDGRSVYQAIRRIT